MTPYRLFFLLPLALFTLGYLGYILYRRKQGKRITFVPFVYLAILVGLLGWQGYLEFKWAERDSILSESVQEISPDGIVNCERFSYAFFNLGNNAGEVRVGEHNLPENKALISWSTCKSLADWFSDPNGGTDRQTGSSLIVVAHEAIHMRGNINEAQTECFALQLTPWLAEQLGSTNSEGARIAQWFYANGYKNMPKMYQSPKCVPDGEWDLTPGEEWLGGSATPELMDQIAP